MKDTTYHFISPPEPECGVCKGSGKTLTGMPCSMCHGVGLLEAQRAPRTPTLPGLPRYESPDTEAPTGVHDKPQQRDQRFSAACGNMPEAEVDMLLAFIVHEWRELSNEQRAALRLSASLMRRP